MLRIFLYFAAKKIFFEKQFFAEIRFFVLVFNHGGSLLSQITVSCRIKFNTIFKIALLKTETFSFVFMIVNALSQLNS